MRPCPKNCVNAFFLIFELSYFTPMQLLLILFYPGLQNKRHSAHLRLHKDIFRHNLRF